MELLLYIVIGYAFGSIPFGLLLTKRAGLGDVREIGSGNIGATNVLRTGNKNLAAATLALDMLKSLIPAVFVLFYASRTYNFPGYVSVEYGHTEALLTGLGAALGHCFPVWLKFKGGKGVATTLGSLIGSVPFVGLFACGIWVLVALVTKISSLSALLAIGTSPILIMIIYGPYPAIVAAPITLLVFFQHRDNIQRLIEGHEPKISIGKKKNE